MPSLSLLIVTGNPFTITGEEMQYEIVKQMMEQKILPNGTNGTLINETLNGPMLKRAGSRGKPGNQLMLMPGTKSEPPHHISNLFQGKRHHSKAAIEQELF